MSSNVSPAMPHGTIRGKSYSPAHTCWPQGSRLDDILVSAVANLEGSVFGDKNQSTALELEEAWDSDGFTRHIPKFTSNWGWRLRQNFNAISIGWSKIKVVTLWEGGTTLCSIDK
jgi:hypothetical protein